MKSSLRFIAFGTSLLAVGAFAQYVKVNPSTVGYGTDVSYGAAFDRSTLITFKAKIKGVSKTPGTQPGEATDAALLVMPFSMAPDRYGTSRMIFADGFLSVELGPNWFVNDQATKLHVNDFVEITGSRMIMNGRRVVIAQTVRHNHNILALRRMSGTPYWYASQQQQQASVAGSSSGGVAVTINPPAGDQPGTTGKNPWQPVGGTMIYGDAYPITGSGNGQAGIINGWAVHPTAPNNNPVIIMGNYWYGGSSGYIQFPMFVRF